MKNRFPNIRDLMEKGESAGKLVVCDPKELTMGLEVEKEHTDNPEIAKKISLDHLVENPKYYSLLKRAGLVEELNE